MASLRLDDVCVRMRQVTHVDDHSDKGRCRVPRLLRTTGSYVRWPARCHERNIWHKDGRFYTYERTLRRRKDEIRACEKQGKEREGRVEAMKGKGLRWVT